MTSDKCEHPLIEFDHVGSKTWQCQQCKVRWVPEDLLREAAQVFRDVEQWAIENYWDTTSTHDTVKDLLRRIDAVLGGK